jgi:hypothetical protein
LCKNSIPKDSRSLTYAPKNKKNWKNETLPFVVAQQKWSPESKILKHEELFVVSHDIEQA